MKKSIEINGNVYTKEATLIRPFTKTPNHVMYLSSLDIHMIKFPSRVLLLFKKATSIESLKLSLSRILVHYYPLAGRFKKSIDGRIEVDCNGKGALFAEGFLDLSASEFLEGSNWPNQSWKKLLYLADGSDLFDVPPVVLHVINLNCGGMIVLTSISHALCDGIGTSQFINAWGEITRNPNSNLSVIPFHSRELLKPQKTLQISYTDNIEHDDLPSDILQSILSQPMVQVSVTFTPLQILSLKKLLKPSSIKCTSFEILASHVWRTWAASMDFPASLNVKLVFVINARKILGLNLPKGFYGNALAPVYIESTVDKLVNSGLHYGVELVKKAKETVTDGFVRDVIDKLEEKQITVHGLNANLAIGPWSRIGFEDVDFGSGKPVHYGTIENKSCLFLPVIGDDRAITVMVSVPERVAEKLEFLLRAGVGIKSSL